MSDFRYGIDSSCMVGPNKDQLDTTFNYIQDPYDVLIEDVYRKLTTAPGLTDPPYGLFWDTSTLDLRDYLLAAYSTSQIANLKADIEAVFYNELRYSVVVSVSVTGAGRTELTIDVQVYPSTDTRPIVVTFVVGTDQITFTRAL